MLYATFPDFARRLQVLRRPLCHMLISDRTTCAQFNDSQVDVGEEVKVVGNLEELGSWDASEGLALQWSPGHRWVGSTSIAADAEFSYKLVKAGADETGVEWEEGDDRTFDLLQSDGGGGGGGVSVSVLWGCPAEYSSSVPYSKVCCSPNCLVNCIPLVHRLAPCHFVFACRTSPLSLMRRTPQRLSCHPSPRARTQRASPSRRKCVISLHCFNCRV